MDVIEYRPGLPTWELIVEVRQLLATERRAERLVCRYLADLADRVQQRQDLALHWYADELHAARSCFGLSARDARERIRVGRALRQLPEIERAFVAAELSYSRVREVTRIATAADEPEWLEFAQRLDMRALERRVAAARTPLLSDEGPDSQTQPQARPKTRLKTRRVTFELSEQAYELLQQALEVARSLSGARNDAEALELLAQQALSTRPSQARTTRPADAAPPHADPTNTAPLLTAPSNAASVTAQPKPIATWSWDELGSGTTQRGSSENDDERNDASALDCGATQRGSSESDAERTDDGTPRCGATQRGSWENDLHGNDADARKVEVEVEVEVERHAARERERWSEVNSRLLRAMGGGGRWIPDTLIEASGLSASEVSSALTYLQLSGRIRRRADAFEAI